MFDEAEQRLTPAALQPAQPLSPIQFVPILPPIPPIPPAPSVLPVDPLDPVQLAQPVEPTPAIQPQATTDETTLYREDEATKRVRVQINGVRYTIRARKNLSTWNVVLHIEGKEGSVQSFIYAGEADVLFDVEYRGRVYKTPVNPRGVMKDLKVNAMTVGLSGVAEA